MILLFQVVDYTQWGIAGGVLFLVAMILATILKIMPTWKDIRLKDFEVRTMEANTNGQIAGALTQSASAQTQLSGALTALGGTLQAVVTTVQSVVVDERHTLDNILILQRQSSSETDSLAGSVDNLAERITSMEAVCSLERGKTTHGSKSIKTTAG